MANLEDLAGLFSSKLVGGPQADLRKPLTFKVSPDDLGNLNIQSIVPADMNLTWISKNVLFDNKGLEPVFNSSDLDISQINDRILRELPVRLPIVNGVVNEAINGVQGLLSQLRGTIPILMNLQVKVSVQWKVYDSDGTTELTSGFVALNSLDQFEISLIFIPPIVELTNTTIAPIVDRYVEAIVTLETGELTPLPVNLPKIKVSIPAIPVPRLVAFFRHRDFEPRSGNVNGALFILVPANSPLRSITQLQNLLDTLSSTLQTLAGLAEFIGFLTGLQELINAIAANQQYVQMRITDAGGNFMNFKDVVLIPSGWPFGIGDITAEDELSSLIYLGPKKTGVTCFNNRELNPNEGGFSVSTADDLTCHVMVRNFHQFSISPSGFVETFNFSGSNFGDKLSSMKFIDHP